MRYWEMGQIQRIFVIIPGLKPTQGIIDLKPENKRMKYSVVAVLLFLAVLSAPAQSDADVEIGVVEKLNQYITKHVQYKVNKTGTFGTNIFFLLTQSSSRP